MLSTCNLLEAIYLHPHINSFKGEACLTVWTTGWVALWLYVYKIDMVGQLVAHPPNGNLTIYTDTPLKWQGWQMLNFVNLFLSRNVVMMILNPTIIDNCVCRAAPRKANPLFHRFCVARNVLQTPFSSIQSNILFQNKGGRPAKILYGETGFN